MNTHRHSRGFTLVELLISFGLTSIVVGGMIISLSQTSSRAASNTQTDALLQELNPALDFIVEEAQQASGTLYGPSSLNSIALSEAGSQRLLGFYVPVPASTQYRFEMFYLADEPTAVAAYLRGPKVLYFAKCIALISTIPGTPTCSTFSTDIVADYFDDDTVNNTFVPEASPPPGQKAAGTLSLKGSTENMLGRQPNSTDSLLQLSARITVRN